MNRETHLGVYAIINVEGNIALILKSRGPYTGSWDLPGGKIEFGESPIKALGREVQEEIGLGLSKATPLKNLSTIMSFTAETGDEIELHHIGIIFDCDVTTPEEMRQTGDEEDVQEARWFAISEIGDLMLTPFAQALIRQLSGSGAPLFSHVTE